MTSITRLFFVLVVVSCAHKEISSPPLLSPDAEKMADMTDRLEKQDVELQKLRLTVSELDAALRKATESAAISKAIPQSRAKKKVAPNKNLKWHPAVVHLTPPLESPHLLPQDPVAGGLGLEDETVADSGQESMNLYYGALDSMENRKLEDALRKLDQFIKLNPKHVYADRAQYLMAEAAFQAKENQLAIVATNVLESRFPYSVRMPDALLIRGKALAAMSFPDKAREVFEKLIKSYPGAIPSEQGAKEIANLSQPIKAKALPLLPANESDAAQN